MTTLFRDLEVESAVRRLFDFLTVRDEPVHADVIFIFGLAELRVPVRAAELFREGYAPIILVSGHMGPSAERIYGRAECDVIHDVLIEHGVPESAILIESRASNTGENVLFGMEILRHAYHDPKMILFVAKPYHSRRCSLTFAKMEPDIKVLSCPPEGDPSLFIPFTKERFALRLVGEVDRLIAYPKEGYIAPVVVPGEIVDATELIRRRLSL